MRARNEITAIGSWRRKSADVSTNNYLLEAFRKYTRPNIPSTLKKTISSPSSNSKSSRASFGIVTRNPLDTLAVAKMVIFYLFSQLTTVLLACTITAFTFLNFSFSLNYLQTSTLWLNIEYLGSFLFFLLNLLFSF